MADSTENIDTTYPVPSFRFTVDLDGDGTVDMRCSSVSGLDQQQHESFEYRDGMGGLFRGLTRVQSPAITFSQVVLPGNSSFYEWICNYDSADDEKKDVTINLTDETGKVYVSWLVSGAFPTQITGPSLDASSNEVAIKQLSMNGDKVAVTAHSV
ncbi:phage tail protein [Streptomyces sp. NPDC002209]|uniref:phage tail protein n=1 Tax=Streptomyces sp. NPDC002209 TaxID=3364638 RepID=UPI0036CBDBB5